MDRMRPHKLWTRLFLLALITTLSACSSTQQQSDFGTAEVCADLAQGRMLFTNEDFHYCLVYPHGYVSEGPSHSMLISPERGAGNPVPLEPSLRIDVVDREGLTTAEWADQIEQETPQFNILRSDLTVGAEPAVMLSRVPGQDLKRQVLLIKGDHLYILSFVPDDPAAGDLYTQMENLYTTVTSSFRFGP